MKKRYLIFLIIILILLTFVFIFFRKTEHGEILPNEVPEIIVDVSERTSQGYKITDDFVLINIPQTDNSKENVEE